MNDPPSDAPFSAEDASGWAWPSNRARRVPPRRTLTSAPSSCWTARSSEWGITSAPVRTTREVVALKRAGARARGATLYVTLEPCNHVGRTPPCTDAIIAAGISRASSSVASIPTRTCPAAGAEGLRPAGIHVDVGCREADARRLIAPWAKFVTEGIPFVTLKLALSLDGRIATRTGASKWITGPEARARVHLLRAQQDAVIVGHRDRAGRRSAAHGA